MSEAMALYLMALLNCGSLEQGETCIRTPCEIVKRYEGTGELRINGCAVRIVFPDVIEIQVKR